MRNFYLAILAVLGGVLSTAMCRAAAPDRIQSIDVEGTAFVVHMESGQVLKGTDLIGATLSLEQPGQGTLKVRIASMETDSQDPDHEVLLHHLLRVDGATGATEELCLPDVQGKLWGFPLRGQWDSEGRHRSNAGYTVVCGDGAQGKCVRFGYKPWKVLPNGTRLDEYYQTCINLVRANYCGNQGTTRDGMLIDFWDRIGINDPDPDPAAAGVRFEAAWNTTGAVCVAHTRVPEHATLDTLEKSCPRLRGHLGDQACPEAGPWQPGKPALLFNRSR